MSSRIAFFNPDNPPLNTSNGTGIITLNDTMDAYEYLTIFYQTGLFLYLGISQVGELNDIFFNPNDPRFNEQWYLKQSSKKDIPLWCRDFRPDTSKLIASGRKSKRQNKTSKNFF